MNDRELASLIWLTVAAGLMLSRRDLRRSIFDVFKTLGHPVLLLPLVGMLAWITLEIWLGVTTSLWNVSLASDTVVWVVGSAFVLYFNVNDAAQNPQFFKNTVKGVVEVTVFVEFFMNLATLGLVGELILQPTLVALALLSATAAQKPEHRLVKRLIDVLIGAIATFLMAFTSLQLFRNWPYLNGRVVLLQLLFQCG